MVLAVAGLVLICVSLAALVYALTPVVDKTREQFRPAPTLFAPPHSYNLDEPMPLAWADWWQEARG